MALRGIIMCFFLTLGALTCMSQETWNLERCIEHARMNNLQIKQSILASQSAQLNLQQSRYALLPSLNADVSHNFNWGRSLDPTTYQFVNDEIQTSGFSATSSLTLFNGFRKINTIRQYELNFQSALYESEKIFNEIALAITASYLQILMSEENFRIATRQLELSSLQLQRTQILIDEGALPQSSILEMKTLTAQDELAIVNSQNQLQYAYLNLMQLLDLDWNIPFRIETPVVVVPEEKIHLQINLDEIYQTALLHQPHIKSSELKLKSLEKNLSAVRGNYYPALSVFGSISSSYSNARKRIVSLTPADYTVGYVFDTIPVIATTFIPVFEQIPFEKQLEDNFYQVAGLRLTIPLFNNLSSRTIVQQVKLQVLQQQYASQHVKNQLKKEIQEAYHFATAAEKKYEASEKHYDATKRIFDNVEMKYNIGATNTFEYSMARDNLVKAEAALLQAKFDYIFRLKILEYYQGKPLTLR